MRAWLRDQGHDVPSRGRIKGNLAALYYDEFPDRAPAGRVRLLPGPDDDLDAWDDMGVMMPADGPESDGEPQPGIPVGDDIPPPPERDPEPAHARRDWRKASKAKPGKPQRITVSVRSDIEGKIGLLLDVPGRVWQARDPYCGGQWVEQVPAMTAAWTRYVCQSPQLVEWFTSAGGGFIAVLDIIAATYPVAVAVMAHHVYHTVEPVPDAQQPSYQDYAA